MQERLRYEAESLQEMHRCCPAHVPELYDFDAPMFTLSMQFLAPPHVVLRSGLLAGNVYPHLAAHAAEFLACVLYRTSALALAAEPFRALADKYSNAPMCALTEQVRLFLIKSLSCQVRTATRRCARSPSRCAPFPDKPHIANPCCVSAPNLCWF